MSIAVYMLFAKLMESSLGGVGVVQIFVVYTIDFKLPNCKLSAYVYNSAAYPGKSAYTILRI